MTSNEQTEAIAAAVAKERERIAAWCDEQYKATVARMAETVDATRRAVQSEAAAAYYHVAAKLRGKVAS